MRTALSSDSTFSARRRGPSGVSHFSAALAWCLCASFAHAAIPESERAVLLELFANTNTDPDQGWLLVSGWGGAPGTECAWYGITCDEAQEHVTKIELQVNRVKGELPAIAALTQLQVFNVDGACCREGPSDINIITGPIPDFSTLTELREIDVASNQLTGSLPDFSQLVKLEVLYAGSNQLTGSIPALDAATNLNIFDVSDNDISGTIPPLNGLTQLTHFSAGSNLITGSIPSLAGMGSLETFDVGRNPLDGTIGSLDGLTNLTVFSAFDCELTGPIPSLSDLSNARVFDVSSNRLTGPIPPLDGLSNLEVFAADANALSGAIPSLDNVPHILSFSVSNNGLTGTIPSLANLPSLRGLRVEDNQLSGSIPPLSGQGIEQLQQFSAGRNQLTGPIPALNGLSNLVRFEIGNNQLSGALPELDGVGVDTLFTFIANDNQLTGAIPALPRVVMTFDVSNNHLSGSIPAFATDSLLYDFKVRNNALTGSIPTLPDGMLVLDVGFNQLTGAVPEAPPSIAVMPGSSALCPNHLVSSESPAWDTATGIAPWYVPCTETFADPDQFGLTGSWYEPANSGQGMLLEIMPDLSGPGAGVVFGSWFTFACGATGCIGNPTPTESQRWYSFQGAVDASQPYSTLTLYESEGGNFAAPPSVGATPAGTLSIAFNDCTHAIVSYHLLDPQFADGSIPLTRLTANTSCESPGGVGAPSNSLLSGGWYDPDIAGQGFMFDISAVENVLFAAWYTFALGGSADPHFGQRWYSLQTSGFAPGATTFADVPVFETTGGSFDGPGVVTTTQVGTADIVFQNCSEMTLTYAFTSGENEGATGTLHQVRLAQPPPGCSVP